MAQAQPVDVNIRMHGVDNASGVINRVTKSTRNLTNQMGRSNGVFVRHRRTIQAVGFQVGDFATQIAGGQSAMLAFTQQGGQLLQFFGPFGAAAAGALAVFGALAIAITRSGASLDQLSGFMGIFQDDLHLVGKAFTALKEFGLDALNLLVNNIDRLLVYAATLVTFFAVRWVAGFVAARFSVAGLTGALLTLRGILLRFLPIALFIALGELVFFFVRLIKATGSFGAALDALKPAAVEVFNSIKFAAESMMMSVAAAVTGTVGSILEGLATLKNKALEFERDALKAGISRMGIRPANELKPLEDRLAALNRRIEENSGQVNEWQSAAQRFWAAANASAENASDSFGKAGDEFRKLKDLIGKGLDKDIRDLFGDGDGGDGDPVSKLSDVANAFKSAFDGMFDAIVDGSKSAIDVLRNLGQELLKIALKAQVFGFLQKAFPGTFGPGKSIPVGKFAQGGVASSGIVSAPTVFPMASGAGLMGERGPEAIMPLTRTSGGALGVKAAGGGSSVTVQIINNAGVGIRHEKTAGPDGRQMQRIILDAVAKGAADGTLDASLAGRFGNQPTKTVR